MSYAREPNYIRDLDEISLWNRLLMSHIYVWNTEKLLNITVTIVEFRIILIS